jgi:hypothetical protein
MSSVNDLKNAVANSANGPAEISVAGMGSSKEHGLKDQLAVLTALAATAAGSRAGIRRVGIRVSSPTGLRFHVPEDGR